MQTLKKMLNKNVLSASLNKRVTLAVTSRLILSLACIANKNQRVFHQSVCMCMNTDILIAFVEHTLLTFYTTDFTS